MNVLHKAKMYENRIVTALVTRHFLTDLSSHIQRNTKFIPAIVLKCKI